VVGCFGLTEPDAGSDPRHAHARREGRGGYVLKGSKMWITNSPIADVFVVWPRTMPGDPRFILEKACRPVGSEDRRKISLRASVTGEIVMAEVFVPEENAFPTIRGLKGPFGCLNNAATHRLGASAPRVLLHAAAITPQPQAVRPPLAANQLIRRSSRHADGNHLGLQACLRLGRLKDEDAPRPR